jgi:hypothetical protein
MPLAAIGIGIERPPFRVKNLTLHKQQNEGFKKNYR